MYLSDVGHRSKGAKIEKQKAKIEKKGKIIKND